jgi:hypothetical protein
MPSLQERKPCWDRVRRREIPHFFYFFFDYPGFSGKINSS